MSRLAQEGSGQVPHSQPVPGLALSASASAFRLESVSQLAQELVLRLVAVLELGAESGCWLG